MKGEIISVGSINLDFQLRLERWPAAGATVIGRDFLMAGGGKAANVAFLARRLLVGSRLVGRVGDDRLAEYALQPLQQAGVDLSHTRPAPGPTGVATIFVRPDGAKNIVMAANANEAWTEEEASREVEAALREAPAGSILVVDLEIPDLVVEKALAAARARGMPVILDPSPAARFQPEWAPAIDYLTPNPAEVRELTGLEVGSVAEAYEAGERLLERGIGTVLLKLGAEGCVVVSGDRRERVPTIEVEPLDTTGAGDAFAGALAVALLEGRDIAEAVRFALVTSALAATRYGSQGAYPARSEIEAKLATAWEEAG